MLEIQNEIKKITSSLIKYFDLQGKFDISRLLKVSYPSSEVIEYDNWGDETCIYALIYELEIEDFLQYRSLLEVLSSEIKEAANFFIRSKSNEHVAEVRIIPICRQYLNWNNLAGKSNKRDILEKIEQLKNLMIAVSTGGPKIKTVEYDYISKYTFLNQCFEKLCIDNPNSFKSLWDWYGRWSQPDLSTYASRRAFLIDMYQPLIDIITKSTEDSIAAEYQPTGWDRVDRAAYEMKKQLAAAATEEQFQAIGMLGREMMITIAQQVFDKTIHKTDDGIEPSDTDTKRMLDAFLGFELSGATNERTRKFAKSAVDMANHLTHDRMATKRDASMCLVSVTSVASLIKLIQENSQE
jgi:hypothetical protein